jgi:iron complex transport system substrate-binding protein
MFGTKLKAIIIGSILSLLLFACSSNSVTPTGQTTTNTPNVENNDRVANRIVALTSLATDIIYNLDKDKLVGISGSNILKNNPELAKIETVSQDRTQPNLEKIIALQPDLVIGAAGFHDRILKNIESADIQTLTYETKSWDSLIEITQTIAEKIDADPKPLLDKYRSFLEPQPKKSASALVLIGSQPIISPNKNSWAGDLLSKFKLDNAAAEIQGDSQFQGYINLSAEKILQIDPDILIAIDTSEEAIDLLKSKPFWKALKATKNDRVYTFDYYGSINPGSIESIENTCNKLKQIDR